MIHHELVGELAPVLRVRHLLVHEAVDDEDAAVGAEGQRDLLVEAGEVHAAVGLVAQLGNADHLLGAVLDGEAEDAPAKGSNNREALFNCVSLCCKERLICQAPAVEIGCIKSYQRQLLRSRLGISQAINERCLA